jgi:hypothetical protein
MTRSRSFANRRRSRALALTAATVAAFLATSGTALANFGVLATWSATTGSGATCQMSLLGGSDSRSQTVFSNIDYGISFDCPFGTLHYNLASGSMAPADSNDALDRSLYPVFSGTGVACRNNDGPYPDLNEQDSCITGATYTKGIPGHRYTVSSSFHLYLYRGGTWTSFPSWCYTTVTLPEGLECYPDSVIVTGF